MRPFPAKPGPWGTPVLLGIPLDQNSSYLRGPARAPKLIREALQSDAWNLTTETRVDLATPGLWEDAGDLTDMHADSYGRIETAIGAILDAGKRPLCLGGDHSVTYPILRAVGARMKDVTLVHFDAHPDLYVNFEGNPHSHASPFARILENRLAKRLIQIGVRTLNAHQAEQAKKFGVEIFEMVAMPDPVALKLAAPIYVSFDMDALDPAFAPGVSHWEPGGMTTREALHYLQALPGPIIGADLVELNPTRDEKGFTATVAAKILKELLGKMIVG